MTQYIESSVSILPLREVWSCTFPSTELVLNVTVNPLGYDSCVSFEPPLDQPAVGRRNTWQERKESKAMCICIWLCLSPR